MIETVGIVQEQSGVLLTQSVDIVKKTQTKRKRESITQNDVMQEFAGEDEYDSDDDADEVDRYIKTKLPFSKDDTLLGWWKKNILWFFQNLPCWQSRYEISGKDIHELKEKRWYDRTVV